MTKAHRLATRKPKLPQKSFPLNFLLGCAQNSLEDFELARLDEVAQLRKELHVILDRTIDAMCQAALSSWFRTQDRQRLKDAIDNEECPIEYAKRMIAEGQRSPEELLPLPSFVPGAAHLAAATRYQKRNLAEGKCRYCPEPLDRNSVDMCTEHLRKARDRQRAKKGPRSEPGSAEYLYSGEVTLSTHGRQAGTLQSLALSREKQTRKLLAEMGVPPESAATATQAVQAAILRFLPTSEAVAVKEADLFAMIGVSGQRQTARNALMNLLKAGQIGRVGQGVSGDPFRYFRVRP